MLKSRSIALGLSAALVLGSGVAAQAYPAGTNPSLGLSSYSRLLPGDSVTVSVARVLRGCNVTIGWDNGQSRTAVAGKTGRTAPVSVPSPSIGGVKVLRASFGAGCASDEGTSVSKTITVGKLVRHSVQIKTSSSRAVRNPQLTLTGKIFWGAVAVNNATVQLSLNGPGNADFDLSATTGSDGVYSVSVGGNNNIPAGQYTVTAVLAADDVYAGSTVTSRTVTIRP
jgi:hypothetical protein